jgi:GNAT superfamily N-acetyltransferase
MSLFITLINPDPEEITLEARVEGVVLSVFASWRSTRRVGMIQGIRQDDGEFLISELRVEDDVFISRTPLLPFEKHANFRRLGIGKRLLREMVAYAKQNCAIRIYGSVVGRDTRANPDLLDWYSREGFTIRDPDEKCLKNAVAMIEMMPTLEAQPLDDEGQTTPEQATRHDAI